MLAVAQTDDDAIDFSIVKLRPFLERIPSLRNTVRNNRYSITNDHWLWASHELIISGPGENAQNSKSVCYVLLDEGHRINEEYPGGMTALNDRMGDRWDRHLFNYTTAPTAGTEVDILYFKGPQNEWHNRCIHCDKPIWLLWVEDPRNQGNADDIAYNGVEVFHWLESDSQTEMMNSIYIRCPYCDKAIEDTVMNRVEMDEGAQYIAKNPGADKMYDSYRWNCFAPRWKRLRDLFATYFKAVDSAKMGLLQPYHNWVTKYLVRSNTFEYPILSRSSVSFSHKVGELWEGAETELFMAADYQAGEKGDTPHFWVGIDQFKKNGDSRRIWYGRLDSWAEVLAMQLNYGIKTGRASSRISRGQDPCVAIDCGYNDKEVFGRCAEYKWFAFKGDEKDEFEHIVLREGKEPLRWEASYSPFWRGNSVIGQEPQGRQRIMTDKFCFGIHWSNPTIYSLLHNLRTGQTNRKYEVPSDISPDYKGQINAWIPFDDVDKKTGRLVRVKWRSLLPKKGHAWDVGAMNLVLAIMHGYYPLDFAKKPQLESK